MDGAQTQRDLTQFVAGISDWAFSGYQSSPHGIHFTLGEPFDMYDPERLAQAYVRAVKLFEATFSPTDEGFALFQNVDENEELRQVSDYGGVPFRIPEDTWPEWADPEGPDNRIAVMRRRPRDLNYEKLCLDHVGNDMGVTDSRSSMTLVINATAPAVFQLYDDRELLIVAEDTALPRRLLEQFPDWVCSECRSSIEKAIGFGR